MTKAPNPLSWKNLRLFDRLFLSLTSLVIACSACASLALAGYLLIPAPTPTPEPTLTVTLSPWPSQTPDWTLSPAPSLTPLPTRRGWASSTPPIYVVTPTYTSFPYIIPSATPTFTRIPPNKSICVCRYDKYDCTDFLKQKQAQACFNFCFSLGAGDVHHLDEDDHDGLACNGLP
jgi:hypothetical protein